MTKKCPPGVICIENVTMFSFVIIVCIVTYFIVSTQSKSASNNQQKVVIREETRERNEGAGGYGMPINQGMFGFFTRPNYGYTNLPGDVLMNPYVPPLRDERYLVPEMNIIPPGRIPINVSTNISAVDTSYRQVGILTPLNSTSKDNILPLMGRPVFIRRSLWNYYTISNQHNNVKLPISVKGRSGLNDNGVDQLYSGDTVYIEGANEVYKVTIYENSTIKYIPFI